MVLSTVFDLIVFGRELRLAVTMPNAIEEDAFRESSGFLRRTELSVVQVHGVRRLGGYGVTGIE